MRFINSECCLQICHWLWCFDKKTFIFSFPSIKATYFFNCDYKEAAMSRTTILRIKSISKSGALKVKPWILKDSLLLYLSCPTFCNPMDCSSPGLPVPHHLLEFAQGKLERYISDIILFTTLLYVYFNKFYLFIWLLGLHHYMGFSLAALSRGYSLVEMQRLLFV